MHLYTQIGYCAIYVVDLLQSGRSPLMMVAKSIQFAPVAL